MTSVPKPMMTDRIGHVAPGRWHEVSSAIAVVIYC